MPASRLLLGRALALLLLMAIAAYSLTPFELPDTDPDLRERISRFLVMQRSALGGTPLDLVFHFCLFVPVGIAAIAAWADGDSRRALRLVLVGVLPVILVIEAYQILLPSRHAHIADLATHLAGTLIGVWIGARSARLWSRLGAWSARHERALTAGLLTVGTLLVVGVIVVPAICCLSLKPWEGQYPLLVGNEVGGQRPWQGEVKYLAIYGQRVEAQALFAHRFPPGQGLILAARPVQSPLIAYDFSSEAGARAQPGGGAESPALTPITPGEDRWLPGQGVLLSGASGLISAHPPRELVRALRESDAFSVEVIVRPAHLAQTGPARIVSLSGGTGERNFTIGQQGRSVSFRVRTLMTGQNGVKPALSVPAPMRTDRWQHVVATYERGVSRLFFNGKPLGAPLDLHVPAAVLFGFDSFEGISHLSVGAHLVAAMLLIFPFLLAMNALLGARRWPVRFAAIGVGLFGLVAASWLARYVLTGHAPDYHTMAWLTLAAAILLAFTDRTCFERRPAL